jgi:hypothetical protein
MARRVVRWRAGTAHATPPVRRRGAPGRFQCVDDLQRARWAGCGYSSTRDPALRLRTPEGSAGMWWKTGSDVAGAAEQQMLPLLDDVLVTRPRRFSRWQAYLSDRSARPKSLEHLEVTSSPKRVEEMHRTLHRSMSCPHGERATSAPATPSRGICMTCLARGRAERDDPGPVTPPPGICYETAVAAADEAQFRDTRS